MGKDVIVALDFDSKEKTLAFLDRFTEEKPFVKIGMELFYAEGPSIVREIRGRGHKIFLDLKLHDIPNTVKKAMAALSALDVDIVNLHAAGTAAMMTAALEGLTRPGGTRPLLIAVTQLTSTDQERMERELWIEKPLAEVVMHYAENAAQAGLDGVVCSPLEAGVVHERCGKDFLTVTPGVRFADGDAGAPPRAPPPAPSQHAGGGPRGRLPPLPRGVRGLMRWETVLFDMDGTLTDSQEGIVKSVSYALERLGRELPPRDTLTAFIGPPLHESVSAICGMDEAETERAGCEFRDYFARRGWAENVPYEGLSEFLAALHAAGLRLIVATSKPDSFARKILEHFALERYFDLICGSHPEDRASADKASVVRTALTRADVTGHAVMVGDRRHDIYGAHANGLEAIGVLYGYGSREELSAAGADFLAADLDELKTALLQQ